MSMFLRLTLLAFGLGPLHPAALSAGSISFQLYAVEAAAADRIPPELSAQPAALAAHLQKMKDEGAAAVPLEFGGELQMSANTDLSKGEDFVYTATFTSEDEELKPENRVTRVLGYHASYRATLGNDGTARLQLAFEWTPTYEEVEIPKGGENGWVPKFHTIKADLTTNPEPAEAFVAATWRTGFPLAAGDKRTLRQLYLVVTWTADPAK